MFSASPLPLLLTYRYEILFPLALVEGPIVSILAGMLVAHGTLSLVPTYVILFLGDALPDALYYLIGRWSGRTKFLERFGKRFAITEHRLAAIEHLWQHHTHKSVMLSKWAYGLSTPLLISAGLVRLPARKYFASVVPLALAQSAVLLTVGYYFGASYLAISKVIKGAGWIVAVGVAIFLTIYLVIGQYVKRSFLKETK